MQGLFEIMVQIKLKRGTGVENPSPRSFSGGIQRKMMYIVKRLMSVHLQHVPNSQLATRFAESCRYRADFWEWFIVPGQRAPQQAARVAGDGGCLLQNIVSFIGLFCKRGQPAPQQAARVAGDVHITVIRCICSSELTFEALCYGVAMISRLLQIIGLFCKRAL